MGVPEVTAGRRGHRRRTCRNGDAAMSDSHMQTLTQETPANATYSHSLPLPPAWALWGGSCAERSPPLHLKHARGGKVRQYNPDGPEAESSAERRRARWGALPRTP
jgi:hypothetical protein